MISQVQDSSTAAFVVDFFRKMWFKMFKSGTLSERDLIRDYETAEKTLFPSIWLSGYDFDVFLDW